MLHSQLVKVCGCSIGFVCVGPRLNEFFLKIFIDCSVWSRRSRNGQDPILCASFPFIDVRAMHISEGMGDFLPRIDHNWVCGVHELIKAELVKKVVGLSSVPFEDGGFVSLEWFVVSLDRVWSW